MGLIKGHITEGQSGKDARKDDENRDEDAKRNFVAVGYAIVTTSAIGGFIGSGKEEGQGPFNVVVKERERPSLISSAPVSHCVASRGS